jgi:hypothetical protein
MSNSAKSKQERTSSGPNSRAAEGFLQPLVIASVFLLMINDHFLKQRFPGFITGKISDFAGMIYFPLFLQAVFEILQSKLSRTFSPSKKALLVCVFATGLVFASIQLFEGPAYAYRWALGFLQSPVTGRINLVAHTMDSSDLIALPALLIPLWLGWKRCPVKSA